MRVQQSHLQVATVQVYCCLAVGCRCHRRSATGGEPRGVPLSLPPLAAAVRGVVDVDVAAEAPPAQLTECSACDRLGAACKHFARPAAVAHHLVETH
jgi:hypothetical protein